MKLGWYGAGRLIYFIYSALCHQLPQRSFFLFGAEPMYSLDAIQTAWQGSSDPLILRQFIGSTEMGWKVAWSDRMVSMYAAIPLWSLLLHPFRMRLKPLSWWGFAALLAPMAADGFTHVISDMTGGIGGGFRFQNDWLAVLTDHSLPAAFYAGEALGSFNSWMRLLTGLLFGLAIVLTLFPRLQIGSEQPISAATVSS